MWCLFVSVLVLTAILSFKKKSALWPRLRLREAKLPGRISLDSMSCSIYSGTVITKTRPPVNTRTVHLQGRGIESSRTRYNCRYLLRNNFAFDSRSGFYYKPAIYTIRGGMNTCNKEHEKKGVSQTRGGNGNKTRKCKREQRSTDIGASKCESDTPCIEGWRRVNESTCSNPPWLQPIRTPHHSNSSRYPHASLRRPATPDSSSRSSPHPSLPPLLQLPSGLLSPPPSLDSPYPQERDTHLFLTPSPHLNGDQ